MKNYYNILCIAEFADPSKIEAMRMDVQNHDPEKYEAYCVLIDPARRIAYDCELAISKAEIFSRNAHAAWSASKEICCNNPGVLLKLALKEFNDAIKILRRFVALFSVDQLVGYIILHVNMAGVYEDIEQYEAALVCYREGLAIAEKYMNKDDLYRKTMAKIYHGLGDLYSLAFEYLFSLKAYRSALLFVQSKVQKDVEDADLINLLKSNCRMLFVLNEMSKKPFIDKSLEVDSLLLPSSSAITASVSASSGGSVSLAPSTKSFALSAVSASFFSAKLDVDSGPVLSAGVRAEEKSEMGAHVEPSKLAFLGNNKDSEARPVCSSM